METIWQLLQQISTNPFWGLGGFLVGIIAIIIAVIFFLRSQKARKPTFFIKSYNLLSDFSSKLDKLQILYGNTGIKNLTVSKIAFWNDGAETIEWSNTVEADPLRIEAVDDCDILDAYIIKDRNKANNFRVELVNNKLVKILFDFLDKGDGGVIQLIHTGKESSDIKLEGLVKGSGKPQSSYGSNLLTKITRKLFGSPKQKKGSPIKQRRAFGVLFLIYAIFMVFGTVTVTDSIGRIVGIVFVLLLFYASYYMFKRRVPKGLEIVEEED